MDKASYNDKYCDENNIYNGYKLLVQYQQNIEKLHWVALTLDIPEEKLKLWLTDKAELSEDEGKRMIDYFKKED